MNSSRPTILHRSSIGAVRSLFVVAAIHLVSCVTSDDRIAGSSTEAGNAGGKLSLTDGRPAVDVAVTLVAHEFLPDTMAKGGSGDVAGSYYRTRTDVEGRYRFNEVSPGKYRVLAVDASIGALADSVNVRPGGGTTLVDQIMKPLGGIRGIAKIVGPESVSIPHVWIISKATLKRPPFADADGAFRLDSLPEGEYELIPQCGSCQPVTKGIKVVVKAGVETELLDTLKLYPEYFFGFPEGGDLVLRSAWLPVMVGGKINRGAEDRKLPASVSWTWNGVSIPGADHAAPEGISETSVLVDSTWFSGGGSGRLRLVLNYPDTAIVREWRVLEDNSDRIWPLSAVATDGAVRIPGPANRPVWRFHVTDFRPLDPVAAAYWGLQPDPAPNEVSLPEWVDLGFDDADLLGLEGLDTLNLTFFLVPDQLTGGRVFRPRTDERLQDISEIRFLELARFNFPDSMTPSFQPGGLIMDRQRGPLIKQRYRVSADGAIEELLGDLSLEATGSPGFPKDEEPLFFYRSGPAVAGYAWDRPLRDAAAALAVTQSGMAYRFGTTPSSQRISAEDLDSLNRLLLPFAQDSGALADTGLPAATGTLVYARAGKRGILRTAGGSGNPDAVLSDLRSWMVRTGLLEEARFPLSGGVWSWIGFMADSSGRRETGDTLRAELTDSAGGVSVSEFLTSGSPGYSADSATIRYFLIVEGDSLVAVSHESAISRLFGRIEARRGILPLTGLGTVTPEISDGIPLLTHGSFLSGRIAGSLEIQGRSVPQPAVFLDGRKLALPQQGQGYLYTTAGGLERVWSFGGRSEIVFGWDRRDSR